MHVKLPCKYVSYKYWAATSIVFTIRLRATNPKDLHDITLCERDVCPGESHPLLQFIF